MNKKLFEPVQQNFTIFDNDFFDVLAMKLSPEAFGVICIIFSQVVWGRRVTDQVVSQKFLMNSFRKLSWYKLRRILDELKKVGAIKEFTPDSDFEPATYTINRDFTIAETATCPSRKPRHAHRGNRDGPIAETAMGPEGPFIIEDSLKTCKDMKNGFSQNEEESQIDWKALIESGQGL